MGRSQDKDGKFVTFDQEADWEGRRPGST
jgi:hypothetical protein